MRVPEMICARIRRTHGSLRWNLQVPTGRGYMCVGRLRAEVATAIGLRRAFNTVTCDVNPLLACIHRVPLVYT